MTLGSSLQLLITSLGCFHLLTDLTTRPLSTLAPPVQSQPQIPLPDSQSLSPWRCNTFPLWIHRLVLRPVSFIIALDAVCVIGQPTEQALTGLRNQMWILTERSVFLPPGPISCSLLATRYQEYACFSEQVDLVFSLNLGLGFKSERLTYEV